MPVFIGADGERSTVRRGLGIELQGFTFDTIQFEAVNFQYPRSKQGWKKATYIVDPVDWGNVVKRGKGNSWRFATGVRKVDDLAELDDDTVQVVKERLARILPGDTSEIEYESLAPYKVHQRCASRFIEGRVLLAGDAAHVSVELLKTDESRLTFDSSAIQSEAWVLLQACLMLLIWARN